MDWQLFEDERNFAMNYIKLEMESYNKTIEDRLAEVNKNISPSEFSGRDFIRAIEHIEWMLNNMLTFRTTTEINRKQYLNERWGEYEIIDCDFYLEDSFVTSYGIKNYI